MKDLTCVIAGALLAAAHLAAHAEYSADLIETSKAWGSVVADFNRDGHDDIFITGHDSNDRVWYWTPSGYTPSSQVLRYVDRHDCDAADVNLDGLLDMYCAVGAEKGVGTGPKELWMQQPDGIFELRLNFGAEDPYGRGRLPIFFDFNRDGYPDIYLTNLSTTRPDGQPNINRVFINQRGKKFVEANTLATGPWGSKCLAKGDINHDGWDDLVVCNERGLGHLYINNQIGSFDDLAPRIFSSKWIDAKLADINGDGKDDLLMITDTNRLQMWMNSGGGNFFESLSFEDALPATAVSLVVGDFNLDGRQDVYVVLRDDKCPRTLQDKAPDLVYGGRADGGWDKTELLQDYAGCGHLADGVDGANVLLMNGGETATWRGPNYVLSWTR
jgi:hypothetical protein